MIPQSIDETLTTGERERTEAPASLPRIVRPLGVDLARRGWFEPHVAPPEQERIYLLMAWGDDVSGGDFVMRGWATKRFCNRVTFWTWDPRTRADQFVFPLQCQRARLVEPLGWCHGDHHSADVAPASEETK